MATVKTRSTKLIVTPVYVLFKLQKMIWSFYKLKELMFIHYMTKITKNVKIIFFDSGWKSTHMHVKNFCLLGISVISDKTFGKDVSLKIRIVLKLR